MERRPYNGRKHAHTFQVESKIALRVLDADDVNNAPRVIAGGSDLALKVIDDGSLIKIQARDADLIGVDVATLLC